MRSLVADTHAAVWYITNSPRLSEPARVAMRQTIESGYPVFISAVSLVELVYLREKSRIAPDVWHQIMQVLHRNDSGLQAVSFHPEMAEVLEQLPREILPDMPDRMIAATALYLGLPLVTADHRIRKAKLVTIW
jgi:PIN domain nuclease of toxin-antitoxin system